MIEALILYDVWTSLNFDLHSRKLKKRRQQANTLTCAWPIVIEGDLLLLNTALKVHVALTDVGFFIRSTDGISRIFVPLIEEAAQSVTVTLSSSRSVCVHTVRPKPTLMARTSVTTRSYIVLTFHCKT